MRLGHATCCGLLAAILTAGLSIAHAAPVRKGEPINDADRAHWAFQPLTHPRPPEVRASPSAVVNDIDRFILARLEAAGLAMAPPATRQTLIRRVTFDLIGLPPTPPEVDAFVNDTRVDAYERLIDALLASPHYGERWGRHWLDLARFAETDGFEHDAIRPHSWRYRDYVIRAFNADKPYDRFIREQIAGDELWPDDPDAVVATGFNLLGPDMVDSSDQLQRRHNTLNDMTDTAALVFMGLTMGCARCHDHKFEPISQRDYFSLQAFFTPTTFKHDQPIPTPQERAEYKAALKQYNDDPQVRELADLETPVRAAIRQKKLAKLPPEARVAHATPPDKRDTEQVNLVLETEEQVAVKKKELAAAFEGDAKERRSALLESLKSKRRPELPMAMALIRTRSGDAKTFVLRRGEPSQPGDPVDPMFPTVLCGPGHPDIAAPQSRAVLADWLTSPRNPLTARVMVNRIWQHHFGRGLVASPSDFGLQGATPSHPELLDWLASQFIAHGWSIKYMHKLMLTSAVYRQASSTTDQPPARQVAIDPDNTLLWRMNRLRLEGEVIRDSLLAISGQLNDKMGGPGVYPPIPKDVLKGSRGWEQNDHPRDDNRRSIYIFVRRNLRFPFLEVFDAPDNNISCPIRERSTTAPQSLTLLNATEVTTASAALAKRIERDVKNSDERIILACRLTIGREPTPGEMEMARAFVKDSPLHEFCRALFNLNDFVYVE